MQVRNNNLAFNSYKVQHLQICGMFLTVVWLDFNVVSWTLDGKLPRFMNINVA